MQTVQIQIRLLPKVYEGGALSRSTLFAFPLSILRTNCLKSKILAKKVWSKVLEILGHLPYT